MQYTTFPESTTVRDLRKFCKGRVPNYSRYVKQGKAALLEFVNQWIDAENAASLDPEPQPIAPIATTGAYAISAITIVTCTILLWLLDAPLVAYRSCTHARQLWADLRLQWSYLQWPQLPAVPLMMAVH